MICLSFEKFTASKRKRFVAQNRATKHHPPFGRAGVCCFAASAGESELLKAWRSDFPPENTAQTSKWMLSWNFTLPRRCRQGQQSLTLPEGGCSNAQLQNHSLALLRLGLVFLVQR